MGLNAGYMGVGMACQLKEGDNPIQCGDLNVCQNCVKSEIEPNPDFDGYDGI